MWQNTPQLCWGRGLGLRLGRAYGSERGDDKIISPSPSQRLFRAGGHLNPPPSRGRKVL